MTRERKTLAELEGMLLARLRELPNGDAVAGVTIVLSDREDGDPGVGVCWNDAGADMRPLVGHAVAYGSVLTQRYEAMDDPGDGVPAQATSSL